MSRAKIVIADRYPVVLEDLRRLFGVDRDFEIIASFSDGMGCIHALRTFAPDVLIIDVLMPGVTALELLSIINSEGLPTRLVLFVSSDASDEFTMPGMAGNYIVIPKYLSPERLLHSIQLAADPQQVIRPSPSDQIPRVQNVISENALATLTERERQIVRLVSEGMPNKEVARRLHVTKGTIKVHLHHIFQKLEINNRTVLAAIAFSNHDRGGEQPETPFPFTPLK